MWLVSIPVSKYLMLLNGNGSFSLCNGYPWLSTWQYLGSAKRHASQWVCKVSTGSLTKGESITPEWATFDGLSRYKPCFFCLTSFLFGVCIYSAAGVAVAGLLLPSFLTIRTQIVWSFDVTQRQAVHLVSSLQSHMETAKEFISWTEEVLGCPSHQSTGSYCWITHPITSFHLINTHSVRFVPLENAN